MINSHSYPVVQYIRILPDHLLPPLATLLAHGSRCASPFAIPLYPLSASPPLLHCNPPTPAGHEETPE